MKKKTWKNKLTKSELKHLKDVEVTTMAQLKLNFEHQAKLRKLNPNIEPCHECKHIARKLGMLEE